MTIRFENYIMYVYKIFEYNHVIVLTYYLHIKA